MKILEVYHTSEPSLAGYRISSYEIVLPDGRGNSRFFQGRNGLRELKKFAKANDYTMIRILRNTLRGKEKEITI